MLQRLSIIFLFATFLCRPFYAQEVPVYSQYILNEFILNPSMAGYDGMVTINLTGRKQWLGLNYSPETYSAAISARILKSPFSIKSRKLRRGSEGRVGLGFVATSDIVGAVQRTIVRGSYAYHIFLNNDQLSFGASVMMTQLSINKDLVDLKTPGDPAEGILGKSGLFPDADFGVSLESKIIFWVCPLVICWPRLFSSEIWSFRKKIFGNNEIICLWDSISFRLPRVNGLSNHRVSFVSMNSFMQVWILRDGLSTSMNIGPDYPFALHVN